MSIQVYFNIDKLQNDEILQEFAKFQIFLGATFKQDDNFSIMSIEKLSISDFAYLSNNNIAVRNFYPKIKIHKDIFETKTLLDISPVMPGRYKNDKPVTWKEWSDFYYIKDDYAYIDTAKSDLRQHHLIAIHNLSYAELVTIK